MGLASQLTTDVTTILNTTWSRRNGQVVPETDNVALSNGAVDLDAVILYADLANSTKLARDFQRSTAAKVVRAYLSSMTRLVKHNGGAVRSFDGDRVMGVFVGDSKNSNAGKCALQMNYVVKDILRPKAEAKFPALKSKGFVLTHCAGVASSEVLVVRGGVRGSNDLVFIGTAPNVAAKLSEIRDGGYRSYITSEVYNFLNENSKLGSKGENMWAKTSGSVSGKSMTLYKSRWQWKP